MEKDVHLGNEDLEECQLHCLFFYHNTDMPFTKSVTLQHIY